MSSDNITAKSVLTQIFRLRKELVEQTHELQETIEDFQGSLEDYLDSLSSRLESIQTVLFSVVGNKPLLEKLDESKFPLK